MAFNVLIVDDSSSMRSVIKKTLKVSGFNVGQFLMAGDGKEALMVLADEWVDLVLTDINMPTMNGMELLAEMKKDEMLKSIPVVMITTEGSEKVKQESIKLGVQGYVKKPFKPEEIKEILNSIMGEQESGQKKIDDELLPGIIKVYPLGVDEEAEVFAEPAKGLDLGLGKHKSITKKVTGGTTGIIIDTRGRRPFPLPRDNAERVKKLQEWTKAIDMYPEYNPKD